MKPLYFLWAFVERFGANILSLAGNLVLAYLLTPDDFGLLAMVSIFSGLIIVLVDAGMGDALLQYKEPTRKDFNTVFFFNLAVAVALTLAYIALARPVALFFARPELQGIMYGLAPGPLLYGLTVTQQTRLRSRLRFKTIAVINLAAVTLALTAAVATALAGGRYWALVVLQTGYPAAILLLLVIFTRWQLRPEFDRHTFARLWKFSVNLLLYTIFNMLAQYVFPMVLGWKFSATKAGYMSQAQKLHQTPATSIETALSLTSYVLIAKKEDPAERRAAVLRMFGVITLVNSLIAAAMCSLAQPLIATLFRDDWLPVVPYLRLMALWGLFYPIGTHMLLAFKLYDRTRVIRNVSLFEKSAIVAAALLLYPWGIETVIIAATLISLIALVIYITAAARLMGHRSGRRYATLLAGSLLIAMFAAAAAYAVTLAPLTPWLTLLAAATTFLAVAAATIRLIRPDYITYLTARIRHR